MRLLQTLRPAAAVLNVRPALHREERRISRILECLATVPALALARRVPAHLAKRLLFRFAPLVLVGVHHLSAYADRRARLPLVAHQRIGIAFVIGSALFFVLLQLELL